MLIPGSMGTASYLLVGLPGAMAQSFGVAQRIEVSCVGAMPRPLGVQVAPPSLVVR